jgi:subtilisin family serine protease
LVKLLSRCIAALVLISLPLHAAPQPAPDASGPEEKAVYIVRLQEPPLVRAPEAAWASSSEGRLRKLDLAAVDSRRALDRLQSAQEGAVAAFSRTLGRAVEPLHRYSVAFDGMAVELTAAEALEIVKVPGVVSVQRGATFRIASDAGPAWTGAPGIWDGSSTGGLPGTQGEGIVIGVIDTGIALSHPSFADVGGDGYNHVNPRGAGNYVGWCNPADPHYDSTLACNDKLIGVWSWQGSGNDPRDTQGHGTHTASIAAGNHVTANLAGGALSRALSGVAPHANVISYDACDDNGYCQSWVVLAAVDQAVADGVDVISMALTSSYGGSPWYDSVAQAFLDARDSGVFASVAYSSYYYDGPSRAPWVLGVASTTHNRHFVSSLTHLSGGSNPPADLQGTGLTAAYGPAAIVRAGNYSSNYYCQYPFPAGTFSGQIVVCDHDPFYDDPGVKAQNVLAAGGGGMVLAEYYNGGSSVDPRAQVLPTIELAPANSNILNTWLSSGSGHMARIAATTAQLDPAAADRLAPGSFSYSGWNIIKPNLAAPGQEILAAHTDPSGYRVLSGTSMAAAHAAGGAALLTALHPGWTPAEIQSALETAAVGALRTDGSPALPFEAGSGRVALSAAARAGLVLHETTQKFIAANPNSSGDPRTLNLAGLVDDACVLSCGWSRTVRSTLSASSHWTVTVTAPAGVSLTVTPSSFTLAPGGTQVLQITAGGSVALSDWSYGSVVLTETGNLAPPEHLPVAVFWVPQFKLSVQKGGTGSGRVTSAPAGIDCGDDCWNYYPEDSSVTLTAAPDPGSVFVGWDGACYGTNPTCSVWVYDYRTVFAYFNPPIPDKALGNQVPLKDSMSAPVSNGTWAYYYADLGSGNGELIVDVLDLDQDAGLYVRFGAKPDFYSANCYDTYSSGTPTRRCIITNPAAGRWWIGVNNEDTGAIHYTVRASWGASSDQPLSRGVPVNDFVSSPSPGGDWKYYFIDLAGGSSDLAVALSSLSADADLYVRYNAKPDRSSWDCASTNGSTVPELCSLPSPAAGRWWVGINNFSAGTVTYTLKADWKTTDVATDFYTVTPCRIFDSRSPAAPLLSGVARSIQVAGGCGIPPTARAVSVNVTIVGPTGAGHLALYPGDEAPPLTSSLNFQAGQTRANNAFLKLGGAGSLAALASMPGGGQVHVIVDVNGYFQ